MCILFFLHLMSLLALNQTAILFSSRFTLLKRSLMLLQDEKKICIVSKPEADLGLLPLTIITKHSFLDVAAALDPPLETLLTAEY